MTSPALLRGFSATLLLVPVILSLVSSSRILEATSVERIVIELTFHEVSLRQVFRRSEAVFLGAVTHTDFGEAEPVQTQPAQIVLEVKESWKGILESEVRIRRPPEVAGEFQVGESYVVWAARFNGPEDPEGDSLWRVSGEKEADFDLSFLNGLGDPDAPGRIVVIADGKHVPGRNLSASVNTIALASGCCPPKPPRPCVRTYNFGPLITPGDYTARVPLPKNLNPDTFEQTVRLEGNDHVELTFLPYPAGRIEGSLFDAEFQPAEGLNVMGERLRSSRRVPCQGAVGADGTFTLRHCEPGKYRLTIAEADRLWQRESFYPGTFDREEAEVIEIAPGDVFELPDWILPGKLEPVNVQGFVYLPDGAPAANASVGLSRHPVFHIPYLGTPGDGGTDGAGYFNLRTYLGQGGIHVGEEIHLWAEATIEIDEVWRPLTGTVSVRLSKAASQPVIVRLERPGQ